MAASPASSCAHDGPDGEASVVPGRRGRNGLRRSRRRLARARRRLASPARGPADVNGCERVRLRARDRHAAVTREVVEDLVAPAPGRREHDVGDVDGRIVRPLGDEGLLPAGLGVHDRERRPGRLRVRKRVQAVLEHRDLRRPGRPRSDALRRRGEPDGRHAPRARHARLVEGAGGDCCDQDSSHAIPPLAPITPLARSRFQGRRV